MRSTEATLETSFPPASSLTTYIFTSTVYLISFNWCRKQFLDWKPLFPKKAKWFIASNISYNSYYKLETFQVSFKSLKSLKRHPFPAMIIYLEETSFNNRVQHYILMSNVIHSLLALLYEV